MAGQANPSKNKYAHLHQLSTDALNALLRADIESTTDDDDEIVFYILEILEQREKTQPTGRLSDIDRAWENFQAYYNTPDGKDLELYPCEETPIATQNTPSIVPPPTRKKHIRAARLLRFFVAAAVVLLAGLMVAQGSGFNVFGALGRWTEETFHFSIPGTSSAQPPSSSSPKNPLSDVYYESINTALRDCGVTEDLAPTWYPDGIESDGATITRTRTADKIYCSFANHSDLYFDIVIYRYNSTSSMGNAIYEKDDNLVEEYTSNQRTFYIMSNIDSTTAAWSDAQSLEVTISGNISKDEIISIIDSIGG